MKVKVGDIVLLSSDKNNFDTIGLPHYLLGHKVKIMKNMGGFFRYKIYINGSSWFFDNEQIERVIPEIYNWKKILG